MSEPHPNDTICFLIARGGMLSTVDVDVDNVGVVVVALKVEVVIEVVVVDTSVSFMVLSKGLSIVLLMNCSVKSSSVMVLR